MVLSFTSVVGTTVLLAFLMISPLNFTLAARWFCPLHRSLEPLSCWPSSWSLPSTLPWLQDGSVLYISRWNHCLAGLPHDLSPQLYLGCKMVLSFTSVLGTTVLLAFLMIYPLNFTLAARWFCPLHQSLEPLSCWPSSWSIPSTLPWLQDGSVLYISRWNHCLAGLPHDLSPQLYLGCKMVLSFTSVVGTTVLLAFLMISPLNFTLAARWFCPLHQWLEPLSCWPSSWSIPSTLPWLQDGSVLYISRWNHCLAGLPHDLSPQLCLGCKMVVLSSVLGTTVLLAFLFLMIYPLNFTLAARWFCPLHQSLEPLSCWPSSWSLPSTLPWLQDGSAVFCPGFIKGHGAAWGKRALLFRNYILRALIARVIIFWGHIAQIVGRLTSYVWNIT